MLVPAFMGFCALAAFSWVGGWRFLEITLYEPIVWLLKGASIIGIIAALWPLRHFKWPDDERITTRIETSSQLKDRPLTAQSDDIALGGGDPLAGAIWREHQARMVDRLSDLTAGAPKPDANRFDPYAIRAILPVLAVAAFFVSQSPVGGTLYDLFSHENRSAPLATRLDAWVNSPAYTKKQPIYLTKNGERTETAAVIETPINSEFFLRLVNAPSDLVPKFISGSGEQKLLPKPETENKTEHEYVFTLKEAGSIILSNGDQEYAKWAFDVTPDTPPSIKFTSPPRAALSGSLELNFEVEDDYGVISAEAKIQGLEKASENARPLVKAPEVPLSLPRQRAKKGEVNINRDLTEHPWAGGKATLQLIAKDDSGQIGKSKLVEFKLPGRVFSKPLALALVEQRRILAQDANQQHYVADLLDAVLSAPPSYIDDTNAFLGMNVAYRRIRSADNDDELLSSLDLLWDIAMAVEFGDLSEVEKRLREAQQALSDALEKGASQEEISKLMKELRQAMNDMMQALREQARNNPQAQNPFQQSQNTQTVTDRDIQKMMDRIEDLAKSGSEDAARELLNEMQRMMDNMRTGLHEQQPHAEGNQNNKALDELSDLMQQQQELMDQTFDMQRRQQNQGKRGGSQQNSQDQRGNNQSPSDQNSGELSDNSEGRDSEISKGELAEALEQLRKQQESLKERLGKLGEQLENLGMEPSDELGQAQSEMQEAGKNLGKGDAGTAAGNQGRALEALRKGAQQMMNQMAGDRQSGGQQQSQDSGDGQSTAQQGQDPLGRSQSSRAGDNGINANSKLPTEIDAQRARKIMEAIRERLSIPDNSVLENNYLERLLKRQ